jgi:iron complex outermembrane receptor protein
MITTKRGKDGKNSIEYDSYVSVSSIREKIDLLTADEFRNYLNNHSELISDWDDGGTSTDWQDEIFRTALSHSHNLAITGGNEKTNYRASFGYMNQEGIIISSGLEKIVGRINVNHKAFKDRLSINLNLTNAMLTSDNTANTESSTGDYMGGIIRDALRFNPTFPVKNSSGEYTFRSVFNQNPVEQADLIDDVTETFRSLGNAVVDFKITDFLSFNTNLGFTKEYIDRFYYLPKASKIGEDYGGRATQESRNNISKLIETNLNFNKTFAEKHTVSMLAGYSYQDFNYRGTFNRTENFISDATSYNNLDGGLVYDIPQSYRAGNKLISFYGRLNYNFGGKYLLTASLRRDGSSRFGENNKWGLFPSAAFAWRIIEEEFMQNQNTISNLKLRMGYGSTGNQEIGNYMSLPTLSAGNLKYLMGGEFVTAVGPDQYSNPNLKWETTTQTNFGIDFGLWENRLNGSLDIYKKNTTDLLLSFDVPQPAVLPTTIANVGEIVNKGFEFELNGVLVQSHKLNWEISGNFSRNINEVISLSNETWKTDEIFTSSVPAPGFSNIHPIVIRPGESMGSFYGYEFIGLDAEGEQQFRDLNGDGEILPGDDQKIIGNYNPDFYYGFSTQLRYGKLSFDMSFVGVHGNQVLNATALDIGSITKLPAYNITKDALNEDLKYGETSIYSSKWIQDASYLRLDYATIGYDLNVSSLNWINKANVYITGQNLFVLTKYKGYDPEVREGIDMTTYPRPRNILMGIRVSF